ncbi:diguanylate cyclase [Caldibacillus lycopersici]|uniref:Diguanylate cyclase n=1 Tax=Perspicuibacillus lycopersici TaxID=1325689 RepID=A0AAE3IV89_9BACI|nr:diguanylate cyclase [Perspicuibacillus lycopersici]MCU9614223.1 diguanylate cyclase [Perspicuibacillus lycopersici]
MDQFESYLLLQFKSEIFEKLDIYNEGILLEKNVQSLIKLIEQYFHVENVQILVNRKTLKENQQLLMSNALNALSFFDEWQMEKFFTVRDDIEDQYLISHHAKFNKKLLLKNSKGIIKGVLLLQCPQEQLTYSAQFWDILAQSIYQYLKKLLQIMFMEYEKKKYKQLQQFTNLFHSSMDINAVLSEMNRSLNEIYPSFEYLFLLANDHVSERNLPIQPLDYTKNDTAAMEAFLTGTIRIEDDMEKKQTLLYFPLKGRQGIYGVLKLTAKDSIMIADTDIDFISILAQTASNAIENAHLYQQSEQLVVDLRLISKVSKELNSNLRLSEIVRYIVEVMRESFKANEVAFVLLKNNKMNVFPESTTYFNQPECKGILQFIKNHFDTLQESVFIGNFHLQENNDTRKYSSIMAEPLKKDGAVIGFAMVVHEQPYYFSFNTFKLFQSLTHHCSLAFTNSLLREELEELVITDYLTKLYSREYLDVNIKKSLETDEMGTFLLLDIDNFKIINDTYGHHVGDDVLIQIAKVIKDNLQEGDIAARWGGEEIAIYLANRSLDEGYMFAKQLVDLTTNFTNPIVTISCGVSYWDKECADTALNIFKRADEALYEAKTGGKNQAVANR